MVSEEMKEQLQKLAILKKQMSMVEYEDEVLEDSTNVKDKRELALDKAFSEWEKEKHKRLLSAKKNKEIQSFFQINTLFPYEHMRSEQETLIEDIYRAVNKNKHIIAHAPTGLGKTIASLGPAIEYALRAKKVVFFLTSRQTQHEMAIRTIKDIENAYDLKLRVLDIVGKKSMCLQMGIAQMSSSDFAYFCKTVKKERTCEYYNNTKKSNGLATISAETAVDDIKRTLSTEEIIQFSEEKRLCPYELALLKGETAQVIISDYSYIFHPSIRDFFLQKIGVSLEECILIIDEAHNLPDRTKDLVSSKLTIPMLQRAIKEAVKFECNEAKIILQQIHEDFTEKEIGLDKDTKKDTLINEKLVTKQEINAIFFKKMNFEATIKILTNAVELIRKEQKRSAIFAVLNVIISWQGEDEGFVRIFSKANKDPELQYTCLDPSILTKEIFERVLSSISISGTLHPTFMYKDLLGISTAELKSYKNPFPKENALHLIVPRTTTLYSRRNKQEFQDIAKECKEILSCISGNTAIFFPSYYIRDQVYSYLYDLDEEFILEEPRLSKEEKSLILKKFTHESLKRKILLGTSSGSFGEGIDLPGSFLTGVIIVGLPLLKPSLEVEKLIEYYNKKFQKGWDYGYFYPSFNKTFQNAGRCIRTEKDKGIIIYLDERFAEGRYLRFFEKRNVDVEMNYKEKITNFYKKDIKE